MMSSSPRSRPTIVRSACAGGQSPAAPAARRSSEPHLLSAHLRRLSARRSISRRRRGAIDGATRMLPYLSCGDGPEPARSSKARGRGAVNDGDPHKIRVGVLFGGRSGEHEISLRSALTVMSAMDPARYDIVPIGIEHEGRWYFENNALKVLTETTPGLRRIERRRYPVTLLPHTDGRTLVRRSTGRRRRGPQRGEASGGSARRGVSGVARQLR